MSHSHPGLCWSYEKIKIEIGRKGQGIVKSIMKLVKKGNGKSREGGSRQQRAGN